MIFFIVLSSLVLSGTLQSSMYAFCAPSLRISHTTCTARAMLVGHSAFLYSVEQIPRTLDCVVLCSERTQRFPLRVRILVSLVFFTSITRDETTLRLQDSQGNSNAL